jgi:hypothetical protein
MGEVLCGLPLHLAGKAEFLSRALVFLQGRLPAAPVEDVGEIGLGALRRLARGEIF